MQTTISLSSPADVVAAVPHMLGFEPEQSLVVISLHEKRVGLVMRLDLDMPILDRLDVIVARLESDGATNALLVAYAERGHLGLYVQTTMDKIQRAGVEVRDFLSVDNGRWSSYICEDPECCPVEGTPIVANSLVDATFAVTADSAPLGSRAALEASVAGPNPLVAHAQLADCNAAACNTMSTAAELERWQQILDSSPLRPGQLTDAPALIVSLQNIAVRDGLLVLAGDGGRALTTLLHSLVAMCPDLYAPQLLATLAWSSYLGGDGALASVCIVRALDLEPEHSLAKLLGDALGLGISPTQLRAATRELAEQIAS